MNLFYLLMEFLFVRSAIRLLGLGGCLLVLLVFFAGMAIFGAIMQAHDPRLPPSANTAYHSSPSHYHQ